MIKEADQYVNYVINIYLYICYYWLSYRSADIFVRSIFESASL